MTMHDDNRNDGELLSALMDGELAHDEQVHVLRRLREDAALRRRWARYHAARAALTGGAVSLSHGFAERVTAARVAEPALLAPRRAGGTHPAWLRPVAGLAIAASVALVAVGGLTLLRDSLTGDAPVRIAERATIGAGGDHDVNGIAPAALPATGQATAVAAGRERQRLLLYLTSHNDYAGTAGIPTVVSYGRLSGLNAGQ